MDDGPDEIRQGEHPDGERGPRWPDLARRLRHRIEVGRRSPRLVAGTAAVAALVVVAFAAGVLVGRRSSHRATALLIPRAPATVSVESPAPTFRFRFTDPRLVGAPGPQLTVAAAAVYALQLKATPENRAGQSREIRDPGAEGGPWSVIVRRRDGSLGEYGAVVTYPVPELTTGATVPVAVAISRGDRHRAGTVGRDVVTGRADGAGGIVWPLNGKFARIRGDLGRSTLAVIAARVSIRQNHPVVTDPPSGYRVVASEPYRAPVVTESRYTDSLRVDSGPIDGLIYSGVVIRGASFEEALYSEEAQDSKDVAADGAIGGHPAIRSPVGGGSATLAWEIAPGLVAFVGYSGRLDPSAATPSLIELARDGRLLGRSQWVATRPIAVRSENSYP